jgi:hypothetical protein
MNSTWQHEITHTDNNSICKEQELILAKSGNMKKDQESLQICNNNKSREQELVFIENTDIVREQNSIGVVSHSHSVAFLQREKNCIINETDDSLRTECFDVDRPNTIEISVPRKSGTDDEKLNISILSEVILPVTSDTLTAEDFYVDGQNTVNVSAPRNSLLVEHDRYRMPDGTNPQDRNDSDVDKIEDMFVWMPKLSLVLGSVAGFVTHGMFRK